MAGLVIICVWIAPICPVYRLFHHLADLGWFDFDLGRSTSTDCLILEVDPELAEQLGKMVEHLE